MKRIKMFAAALAVGAAILVGTGGTAMAYPGNHWGGQGMNQEQQAAIQKEYADHYQAIAPLQQELMAKRSELEAMYYGNTVDNNKVQSLFKNIADLEAKLFTANTAFQKKLADKGIPYGGYGMGYGGGYGGHRGGYAGHRGGYAGHRGGYGGHRGGHGGGHW